MFEANSTIQDDKEQKAPEYQDSHVSQSQSSSTGNMKQIETEIGSGEEISSYLKCNHYNATSPAPAPVPSTISSPLEPEHSRPSDHPIPPNTDTAVQRDVDIPAQKQASSQVNIKKEETAPPLLGISSYQSPYTGGRTFNYKEKYPDDEPLGEELNDNSRVFKVYLDEVENFDDDLMRGFRDTIDSLLVFHFSLVL
ncbi:ankyrin repeat protein [Lentinula edodes]|uniref:Ankyrin repeat protein n=1 Tax=Lentinula edodes TaxID=5353 RepID=A0A1Q3E1P3_LENED|nr:ankyrin repeat protein [Lentinula edodes]